MRYYVDDYDGSPENSYPLPNCKWVNHLDFAAEEAAENFHSYHDGWESDWPLTFVMLDDELNEIGRFLVDRESVPQFRASHA